MTDLEIWAPRYSHHDCCILASKVTNDQETYRIWFSKAKHLEGNQYVMTGAEIKEHGVLSPTNQGGKVVYAIPLLTLEKFKIAEVL